MDLATAKQLVDIAGVQIEQPAIRPLLPGHPVHRAVSRLLVVAELHRNAEDPHRQAQPVILGQIDEVRLADLPAVEDFGEREVGFFDMHALPSPPNPNRDVYLLFLSA